MKFNFFTRELFRKKSAVSKREGRVNAGGNGSQDRHPEGNMV